MPPFERLLRGLREHLSMADYKAIKTRVRSYMYMKKEVKVL